MEVYSSLEPDLPLSSVAAEAERLEALGVDGIHVPETVHDSLAVALLALQATSRVTVRTAVTLAFVRSPTLVAYAAWDLQRMSGGRFELGLGSQVRQNVEDRHGMPWSEPVERMRDYLRALHALFAAFQSGELVPHEGPTYAVTRLQPYFNPGPCEHGAPPLWLGAVNARMCSVAGDLATGVVTHPTNSSPSYLAEVVRPALGGKRLVTATTLATGVDDEAVATDRERQRRLLAFLYSTPAYATALERVGLTDLQPELARLTRDDRWADLERVLTDDALDRLILTGRYDELPDLLRRDYGSVADGIVLRAPADRAHDEAMAVAIEQIRGRASG